MIYLGYLILLSKARIEFRKLIAIEHQLTSQL